MSLNRNQIVIRNQQTLLGVAATKKKRSLETKISRYNKKILHEENPIKKVALINKKKLFDKELDELKKTYRAKKESARTITRKQLAKNRKIKYKNIHENVLGSELYKKKKNLHNTKSKLKKRIAKCVDGSTVKSLLEIQYETCCREIDNINACYESLCDE